MKTLAWQDGKITQLELLSEGRSAFQIEGPGLADKAGNDVITLQAGNSPVEYSISTSRN